MKRQITLVLSLIAMVVMMASCDQPSVVGTWKAKNADVKKVLQGVFDEENLEAKNASVELEFTDNVLTETMNATISYEEDDIKMDVDLLFKVVSNYKYENGLITKKYVSHKYDIKDISFDADVEEALAASGVSKKDIKKEMLKNVEDDEDIKKDCSYIVKSIETNRMELEDEEGTIEYIRMN